MAKAKIKLTPLRPGLEIDEEGHASGVDPRHAPKELFAQLGHEPLPILRVIRAHCLDCANSEGEVRKCPAVKCSLWPYRMAKNPLRAPKEMSDEQRRAAGERMKRARAAMNNDEESDDDE